jgi:hypothetical protein
VKGAKRAVPRAGSTGAENTGALAEATASAGGTVASEGAETVTGAITRRRLSSTSRWAARPAAVTRTFRPISESIEGLSG